MALRVFTSIADAKREGFEMYDRAPVVHIVRKKSAKGWELAVVQLRTEPSKKP